MGTEKTIKNRINWCDRDENPHLKKRLTVMLYFHHLQSAEVAAKPTAPPTAPNRPDIADKPRTTSLPLDDESARAAAFETYYAYYGTWSFDPGSSTVTHHIHSSLLPYEVGRNYRRLVTFDGQRLRLTVDPSQDRGRGKQLARRVLTWERITAPR